MEAYNPDSAAVSGESYCEELTAQNLWPKLNNLKDRKSQVYVSFWTTGVKSKIITHIKQSIHLKSQETMNSQRMISSMMCERVETAPNQMVNSKKSVKRSWRCLVCMYLQKT